MVTTRSQTRYKERIISRQEANDMNGLIREKARQITSRRSTITPKKSPSKRSQMRHNKMSKRESTNHEKLLSTTKENLSKASDRILPARPQQPRTLAKQLFDEVVLAKQNLKRTTTAETTTVIVIDDDD